MELLVQATGKLAIAATAVTLGVLLLQRWRQTGSRVVLHWAIMFVSSIGYLFGVMIILGWGNPSLLTRLHYFTAFAAILPGALSATILMLPLTEEWGNRLSHWVPLGLFAVVTVLLIIAPLNPGLPHDEWIYAGLIGQLFLGMMIGAGLFSAAVLFYTTLRVKNLSYLALAVAFLLITMGGRLVGGDLINLALGEIVVVVGFVVFYLVFMNLMQVE